jgi:hypothetical protein
MMEYLAACGFALAGCHAVISDSFQRARSRKRQIASAKPQAADSEREAASGSC